MLPAPLLQHRFTHPHRIINGNTSELDSWPLMAVLLWPVFTKGSPFCSGVVWDHLHILTTAHCLFNRTLGNFQVYLGHTDITTVNRDYLFDVEEKYVHPYFHDYREQDPETFNVSKIFTPEFMIHDIAVLKLSRPIDFEDRHRKVWCVCEPEPLGKLDTDSCITLGWGTTKKEEQPLQLHEALVKAENCMPQCKLGPGKILAADLEKNISSCHGDSGGPMLCALKADADVWSLVGLVSYGDPECQFEVTKECVYTRVWHYIDFIENITGPSPTIRPINSSGQLHCQHQAFIIIFGCVLLRLAFG